MQGSYANGPPAATPIRTRRQRRAALERYLLVAFLGAAAVSAGAATWMPSFLTVALLVAAVAALAPLAGLLCGAAVEGDFVFADTLPIRCIWDQRAIGQFGASEVERAWIERTRLTSIGVYTSVVIRSKRGETATFGGVPDVAADERQSIKDPALLAFHDEHMSRALGDLHKGLDWLREHGVPVEIATAESERRPKIRTARIAAAVTAVVVPTAVGVSLREFSQTTPNSFWVGASVGLYLASTVAAVVWRAAFRTGSAASDVALYSERLPLSCLWDAAALGAIRAEDIKSARLDEGVSTRASLGGPRLRVTPHRGRDAVFMRSVAPSEFDRALKWLDDRGIPVDDGWHVRAKIGSGHG